MKTIKFFALALATFALVACEGNGGEPNNNEPTAVESITLSETNLELEVGATHTLVATVTPAGAAEVVWSSSDETKVTVAAGVVTAVAEGNAMVVATAGAKTAMCLVSVKAASGPGTGGGNEGGAKVPEGSEFYPIIMDAITAEALGNKIITDFRPDGMTKNLWVWDNTYAGATASGLNYFGNTEGYTALTVGTVGWSGMGYCAENAVGEFTSDFGTQAAALIDKMLASPEDYFLHMAIKSTDNASHTFYFGCTDATKFVLGSTVFDGGAIFSDFPRDGAWHAFDIPVAQFANGLAASARDGANIFVALSGGTAGVQLNLDAVYFYKK